MTICQTAIAYATVLILGDLSWRFGRVWYEIFFYPKHYPPNAKIRTAFRLGFTMTNRSLGAILFLFLLLASQSDSQSTMYDCILEKWLLLPVYWLFRYAQITKSMFDDTDFIRSDSDLDAAAFMVSSYFHAYLNTLLPRCDKTYGNKFAVYGINIIIAELCWRFLKSLREINYAYKNRTSSTAFTHGFTFSSRSRYLLGIVALLAIGFVDLPAFCNSFLDEWPLLPIWWVARYTDLTRSMLDYSDFIRSTSGLDYGSGMAANYFHAYINEALIRTSTSEGILERILKYESKHRVQFAVKRLFILIPFSCHTKPVLESPLLERQENQPLEDIERDRAGVKRPYSNAVYRIVIDNKPYYITVEGATPLLSFHDSLISKYTATPAMLEMQREILIKFKQRLQNILQKCPGTQGLCEVVFFDDYKPNGEPHDVGEILALHIKRMWEKMPPNERPSTESV